MKAILLNSADDLGTAGPDFESGFGNLDALGAIRTVQEKRFFSEIVSGMEEKVFAVTVPPGCRELKVTLAWHDPEAAPNAERALVNNLELEVVQSATQIRWLPWVLNPYPASDSLSQPARRQRDHLNNVEQSTLALPEGGSYLIHVKGIKTLS